MLRSLFAATLVGALALPLRSTAQEGPRIVRNEQAPLHRSHYVPIAIEARATTTVSIVPLRYEHEPKAEIESAGVECEGYCTVQLPPGEYRVSTVEKNGKSATRTVRFHDPERLWIGPASDLPTNVCLALAVAGSLMVPVGAIILFSGPDGKLDTSSPSASRENQITGLGIGAAGAALAIAGFVLYSKSLRFELERAPLLRPVPAPSLSFDFDLGPERAQLGVSFAF